MRNYNIYIYLALIIVFGGILRLIHLSSFPPSLNWDEVSHGYNAFSILKTGKDQWGQLLPIFNFRAYGDYPLPLNLYLTIPFIAIFGLTEFSIRFPHALLGIGTIIATYFLVKGITKKESLPLLASLLIAIEPWALFTSRFVVQSNLAVFFLTASAAAFFNREKNKYLSLVSLLLLELTLFSYNTTRIVSPLILILAFIIYWNELKKYFLWGVLFLIPLVFVLINPESRARTNFVFLIDAGAVNKIESQRQSSNLPQSVSRLIYNRPVFFAESFLSNYIGYFSPKFLFTDGGTQYQFSIPNQGLLYLVNLPFFYLGLVFLLIKSLKSKDYKFLLGWLLLAPIPAALTQEKFAVIRSTAMLPLPQLITVMGIGLVWERIKNTKIKYLGILYFVILFLSVESYMSKYMDEYPKQYSWAWQYGYKQAVEYAKENYSNYDKIIITKKYGEPHEFFLFFMSWDPAKYQSDPNSIKFFQSNWYWVDRFDDCIQNGSEPKLATELNADMSSLKTNDNPNLGVGERCHKFYFVNDWQVKEMKLESGGSIDCAMQKCLLIASPDNFPKGWQKLKTINFLDTKPAFEIYAN